LILYVQIKIGVGFACMNQGYTWGCVYGEKLSLIICCYKLRLILGLCVYKPRLGLDLYVCKRTLVLVCMCITKIGLGLCVFMLAAASPDLLLCAECTLKMIFFTREIAKQKSDDCIVRFTFRYCFPLQIRITYKMVVTK
jgi:hypothetical protein